MIRIVLGVVLAAAGLAACTYYEPAPVALVPATTTVAPSTVVVPAPYTTTTVPYTTTTVIERQRVIQ